VLDNISRVVDGVSYLADIELSFEPGSFNVLLGRTLAGKTSLLRVIAGLDKPTQGRIMLNGIDVTKVSVQKRKLSMVYQQFINYPHLSVWENIASPLKLAKVPAKEIKKRVQETAELLHIEQYLSRLPLELSGGQQQRCAMARALVKDADLILFDEPLVNLDYKLREELRSELKNLFKHRETIAIYATTEAHEALALGGSTTLLHQGKTLQSGPAIQQFAKPVSLDAADLYNEPPLNRFDAKVLQDALQLDKSYSLLGTSHISKIVDGDYRFAIRPDHVQLQSSGRDEIVCEAQVDLAEISASETYLHVSLTIGEQALSNWVIHLFGIHNMPSQTVIPIFIPLAELFVFDKQGQALCWPSAGCSQNVEQD
jgi:glycerol transport system ATP-binding protein